jgi:hypothetical protein
MIEAVNSTVANATALRASVEAVSAARAPVDIAPAVKVGEISAPEMPKAPYISPYISIDVNYDKAVLQIRNSETGDVLTQFPSESRLAQIRRSQATQERASLTSVAPVETYRSEPVKTTSSAPAPSPVEKTVNTDIITVQEVTSTPAANVTTPTIAIAAFSAGAQTASASASAGVSVFA